MTEDRSAESLKRQLGELQQLVEQKNAQIHNLHAKIRGYDTLGSVCQEKINECQRLESHTKELKAQLALLQAKPVDPSSQREHGASGSNFNSYADAQCQTEENYPSLSSIETHSMSLLSLSEANCRTAENNLVSQDVEGPLSDVTPTVWWRQWPSSQLDQLTIAVRKLEKQYFTQQTVVDGLNTENNRLKSTSSQKDQHIVALREENQSLREKLVKASDSHTEEPASLQDMHEWVKVEKTSSQTEVVQVVQGLRAEPAAAQHAPPVVTQHAPPAATQHADLQREIRELQVELESFKIANDQWKEHSRRTGADHDRQAAVLRQKLVESQQQVQQLRNEQEQHQKELDKLLMTATEKLLSEQQMRQESERRLMSETHRLTQDPDVKAQVTQLQQQVNEQQQIIQALTEERHNSLQQSLASLEMTVSGNFMTPEALRTQVAILQQQVAVYKDDFNSERADRERTQEDKERVQSQLTRVNADLAMHKDQIAQLRVELCTAQSERVALLRNKQEQEEVTRRMRQRIRELDERPPLQYVNLVQSEHNHRPHRPTDLEWTCARCTYSNIGARSTCEMCGAEVPSCLPLTIENMPAEPLRFVARNVEQCDAASDDKSDAVDDKTTTTKTTTSL
ncbi:hypothetical protein LSAT2_013450 [Lamellibrachia satsuma]|nr:hypothetical protein LSAT2_013450 [Lamellibrachia satsuma]